jgi:hypothetical protein
MIDVLVLSLIETQSHDSVASQVLRLLMLLRSLHSSWEVDQASVVRTLSLVMAGFTFFCPLWGGGGVVGYGILHLEPSSYNKVVYENCPFGPGVEDEVNRTNLHRCFAASSRTVSLGVARAGDHQRARSSRDFSSDICQLPLRFCAPHISCGVFENRCDRTAEF